MDEKCAQKLQKWQSISTFKSQMFNVDASKTYVNENTSVFQ